MTAGFGIVEASPLVGGETSSPHRARALDCVDCVDSVDLGVQARCFESCGFLCFQG